MVHFIKSTASENFVLGDYANSNSRIFVHADASYGVHMNGKSHVISLGTGPIFVKFGEQKWVTKSNCEVEIIALSDIFTSVLWGNDLLVVLEGELQPPKLLKDNETAIELVTNGASTAGRSKHVHTQKNFVKQFLNCGKVGILHCPTSIMVADLLTKPFPSHTFSVLREILFGKKSTDEG